jgi:response regulator RpfG family c-di-GMP phosphodiesterase
MLRRILFVDDEPNVLHALERQFRKEFDVETAVGPAAGLQKLADGGPFAVVVSDMRMPGMDGAEFLRRVRQKWADTVRIMLTGQADLTSAMAAVNQGNIFQFLTKPCPGDVLTHTLNAALEQHRLITAERELLEGTLHGSISVLSEVLSLVNPTAFGRAHRIRRYVRCMAEALDLPDRWQYEMAAMLSQIGCVAVPPEVLEKYQAGQPLDDAEKEILKSQGKVGYDLLARIPRLEIVAQMVAHQATERPAGLNLSESVSTGAQLLTIARDFDEQIFRGGSLEAVLSQMKSRGIYNQAFVSALQEVELEELTTETRSVSLAQIKTGMILNYDVLSTNGILLMGKGQEITESAIIRLRTFAGSIGIKGPISVLVPSAGAMLSPTTMTV